VTDRFESILDECISALQAGVPLEDVLAEVPEYSTELRPLLYAAMVLTEPKPDLVPAEKKAALRAEYMRHVAELPAITPSPFREKVRATTRVIKRRTTSSAVLKDLITIAITIVLTLTIVALALGFLSANTIPGDFLYGTKRMYENVRLSLTFSPEQRTALAEEFNQRRLSEIEALIEQNRAAVIQFKGRLETKGDNLWIVENHTVFLPNDIRIEGDIEEGDTIEITGLLRSNNVLVADTITLVGRIR
jgi:hypothetical protein